MIKRNSWHQSRSMFPIKYFKNTRRLCLMISSSFEKQNKNNTQISIWRCIKNQIGFSLLRNSIRMQQYSKNCLANWLRPSRYIFYLNNFANEASIQKLYGIFCDATSVYLVLEPVCGKAKRAGDNDQQIIKSFNKILSSLEFLHQHHIILRNMDAASLINQMGVVKITNIIRATVLRKNKRRQSFFGSLHQTPHQLVIGQSYDSSYDMWSLGLVLYQLMLNFSPFQNANMALQAIKNLQFKLPLELPNDLAFVISSLLCEKQKRLSAEQCLKLEFFTRQGKDYNLVNRDIYNFWIFQ